MMPKSKKRKNLKDLSAEEFFSHGLDSDISSDSEDDNDQFMHKKEPNSLSVESDSSSTKASKHKEQLTKLENKDPEFYEFLKENEPELLNFDESEESSDESSNDEEVKNKTNFKEKSHNKKENDMEDGENGDEDDDDGDDVVDDDGDDDDDAGLRHDEEMQDLKECGFKNNEETVTSEMLAKLKKGLHKNSLFSLRRIMRIFHAAVMEATDDDEKDSNIKFNFKIESSSVFNNLVQICLKSVSNVLQHHLSTNKVKKSSKKPQLPSTCKSWSKVKVTMKCYLKDLLQLLRQLAEPDMLAVILKHVNEMALYYACFPRITKMLVKRLVRMWSSAEEHVRVLAFITIRKISLITTNLFDFILKQLYMSFVKNAKFLTPSSRPAIIFMENSLVEMFSIDHNITYQYGFIYIRQMAIHLRNAISMKQKDSYQSVYNWQYIICIKLWSRILADLHSETLSPLIYPLVQVTLGVIRLIPTARFYPLRFHCIRALNALSKSTSTYIPIASYLIEILESPEFNRRAKPSMTTISDLSCLLKLPKAQLHTRSFQDLIIDNVCNLLLEHFVNHSTSIAFPELIFPVCLRMKRFMKKTEAIKFRKQIKQIVDKLQEAGHEVSKKRSTVNFSPKDLDEVKKWEMLYGQQKNSLQKFHDTWLTMAKITESKDEKSEDIEDYSDEENVRFKYKHKKIRKQNLSETDKKTSYFKDIPLNINDKEDFVEDFKFSSDDDD